MIYKQWLDEETEQKEYLQKLLLFKAGYLNEDIVDNNIDTIDYPSLGKRNTLSHMRAVAQRDSHNRKLAKDKDEPATDKEMTPAERLFQESLANTK